MLLLRAIAGSHLYGYSTPASDYDFFEVHSERFPHPHSSSKQPVQALQTIVDGMDITQVTLSHFMELAESGSHQALDAMFAKEPEFDLISGLRNSYYAGLNVVSAYERIITKFALQEGFRKQRHSVRAMLNISEILTTGRYVPELSAEQVIYVNMMAGLPAEEFKKQLQASSPVGLLFE
jgi:hypothetical protein